MISQGNILIEGNYRTPEGRLVHGQIKVVDGVIADISDDIGKPDIVYDSSFEIFPGFIDVHVHGREYPRIWIPTDNQAAIYSAMVKKEDFMTMSSAAINGGVVCAGLMPNDPVPPIDHDSYYAKQKLAENKCTIDWFLYALIQKNTDPQQRMSSGLPSGDTVLNGVPWKLYAHDMGVKDIKQVLAGFKGLKDDPVITVHAESRSIVNSRKNRPPEAEVESIRSILDMALAFKLRVHIAHVSTAAGLEHIVEAKSYSTKITCETTPTYLYFSDENKGGFEMAKYLFMKPPIRTEHDRQRLLEGIVLGDVDILATDHAPHTFEDKRDGQFGIPLIDHYTNFVGWLMQNGMSEKRVQEVCAENPAKIFGKYLDGRFGRIQQGYVGSFTVAATTYAEDINNQPIMTKCGWSPFRSAYLGDDYLLYAYDTIIRGVPMKHPAIKESA